MQAHMDTTTKKKRDVTFAILGYGGMGHVHARHIMDTDGARLAAACDVDPAAFGETSTAINLGSFGTVSADGLRQYLRYEDMAEAERGRVDALSICLPAHLHAEYAVRAMRDGFHVLVEKPMATTSRDALRMAKTARETGKTLMVAHCIRFEPVIARVAEWTKSGRFGKLLKLHLFRVAGYNPKIPGTKRAWFYEADKSGGAILDIHLHDIDWLVSAFGPPAAVSARGAVGFSGGIDEVTASFRFPTLPGVPVTAEASWMRGGSFEGGIVAVFEKAVYQQNASGVTLRTPWREELPLPPLPGGPDMYGAEIEYFTRCVSDGRAAERCLPESTATSVRLVEAERRSAARDGAWVPFRP